MFEAIQDGSKSECSRLEQTSDVTFLQAEKWKPWKIYGRMCDVYRERYFDKKYKKFMNTLDMGLLLPESKRQLIEWKHIDSLVKKKFQVQQSVKKVMLIVFQNMKVPMTIGFLEKDATL